MMNINLNNNKFLYILLGSIICLSSSIIYLKNNNKNNNKRNKKNNKKFSYCGLIGNTPIIELKTLSNLISKKYNINFHFYAKAEFLNPGGTSKDRIALGMINYAESLNLLIPKHITNDMKGKGIIVEGTSGSTGIALASIARERGYKCVIFMPDDQAKEKIDLLKIFGAEVHVVPTASIANPDHYCKKAEEYAKNTIDAVYMNQFENLSNWNTHYNTTGYEIWNQLNGKIDLFVMSAGTGGTIAGVSKYLKEKSPSIEVTLIDPPGSSLSSVINYGVCFTLEQSEKNIQKHRYDTIAEGIGLDRITKNFEQAIPYIDNSYTIPDQYAIDMAHYLLDNEGIFVGSSSSMNCVGSLKAIINYISNNNINIDKNKEINLITILCDNGSRYMTRFWNQEYIENVWNLNWPNKENENYFNNLMNFIGL